VLDATMITISPRRATRFLLACLVVLLGGENGFYSTNTNGAGGGMVASAQHLEQETEFLFPPPPNASLADLTLGYNPWMTQYTGAPESTTEPTFVLMVGACITEEMGGTASAQFYSDAVVAFWQECQEKQMQCQCRPMAKPDRWNPPQEDRSIYNGMADTEWELHRLFREHEQGLISVGGITIKASFEAPYMFDKARELDIPLFLLGVNEPWPGDREESFVQPHGYIGTNNAFLGTTMARLVKQLRPDGGTFAFIMSWGSTYMIRVRQGFLDEMNKDQQQHSNSKDGAQWNEVDYPYNATPWVWGGWSNCPWTTCMMEPLANPATGIKPTAIIFLFQNPIKEENYTTWVDLYRDQNITLIGFDALDYLDYLSKGYLDGLVGQVTFEMGTLSAQVMHDAHFKGLGDEPGQLPLPPNKLWESRLVAYNKIPLDLDVLHPLDFDQNLIGKMSILGFTAFGVVIASAMGCLAWTIYFRSTKVVSAAQPFFLVIVVVGVIILASAMIPLSFDDDGDPSSMSETFSIGICMSIPWLGFTGISVIFAALFSKTWRINRLFNSKNSYVHVKVSKRDVLAPFAIVFFCNVLILTIWTILDPLKYERVLGEGTDFWNRNIESIGVCRSENSLAFLLPLAFIDFAMIVIATWQAFATRRIESEFAESKFILMTTASLFQAFLTGIPVAAVVKDDPQAYYLVTTLMVFLLSEVILSLIFIPKMLLERRYAGMTESEVKNAMVRSIQKSGQNQGDSSDFSSMEYSTRFGTAKRKTYKFGSAPLSESRNSSRESAPQSVLPDRMACVDSSIVTTHSTSEMIDSFRLTQILSDDISEEAVARYLRARGLKRAADELLALGATKEESAPVAIPVAVPQKEFLSTSDHSPKKPQRVTSELDSIQEQTAEHAQGNTSEPIHSCDDPTVDSEIKSDHRPIAAVTEGPVHSSDDLESHGETIEDHQPVAAQATPQSEHEIVFDRESNAVDEDGPLFQKHTPEEEDTATTAKEELHET